MREFAASRVVVTPAQMVVTPTDDGSHKVVTPPAVVVTRHGKYLDPEARKAYQRARMRALRLQRRAKAVSANQTRPM